MDTRIVIAIIVAIVIVVILAAFSITRRRSARLKQKFGTEYDRAVQQSGDAHHAESVLHEREERVEKFSIHPLSPGDRERYAEEWAVVQRRFVDDPSTAVNQADKLVTRVMEVRGYPMGDFEQRAADISVNYPSVVQNYRSARDITLRHNKGESTTEELRRAMVHYRSLFDELLETPRPQRVGVSNERIAS